MPFEKSQFTVRFTRGNEKRVNRLVCVDGFKKRVMPDCDDCYGQSPSFFRNGEKQFIFSQH